jgi:predicted nucleic acid-binding protein
MFGLIALAKDRGLVDVARPIITRVRAEGGPWLSDKLIVDVLNRLGE